MGSVVLMDKEFPNEVYAVAVFHTDVDLDEINEYIQQYMRFHKGDSLEDLISAIKMDCEPIVVIEDVVGCKV